MINVGYVNGSIDLESEIIFNHYESFLESCGKEIDSMFSEFDMIHEKVTLESEIMGTVPEHMMVVYEAGKKNIFEKIGDMIIKLFNKIKDIFDKVIDKMTDHSIKNKSNIQKAEILIKRHPKLADQIVPAFRDGSLTLNDAKSLKELDDVLDECMNMAKKKDADPTGIKNKWEKAKKKYEEDGIAVTTAKKADTVIKASVALAMFIPNCSKAIKALKEMKQERHKKMKDMVAVLDEIREMEDAGKIEKSKNMMHLLLQAQRYIDKDTTQLMRSTMSTWTKLTNWIANTFGGIVNDKTKAKVSVYKDELKADASKKKEEEDSTREAEQKKRKEIENHEFQKGYMNQAGRNAARNAANKPNDPNSH